MTVGRPVEARRDVDHAEHLHDPRMRSRSPSSARSVARIEHAVMRAASHALLEGHVAPDLAGDHPVAGDRSVPADVHQAALDHAAHVVAGRREHRRQLDPELRQPSSIRPTSGDARSSPRSASPRPSRGASLESLPGVSVRCFRPGAECRGAPEGRDGGHTRGNIRPVRWYFGGRMGRVHDVIRAHGAPSIAQGRTPHEVQDELCRVAGVGRV